MNRSDAQDKLREWIKERAGRTARPLDVDDIITAIEGAFKRFINEDEKVEAISSGISWAAGEQLAYVISEEEARLDSSSRAISARAALRARRGQADPAVRGALLAKEFRPESPSVTIRRASKIEQRKRAKKLAKAAAAYRAAIERSEALWPWLLDGSEGPDTWGAALAEVQKVETRAIAVADRLTTRQAEPRDLRVGLGIELTMVFGLITRRRATPSKSSDFHNNKPGTLFGYFVHLALSASSYSSHPKLQKLAESLSSFVWDAAKRQP